MPMRQAAARGRARPPAGRARGRRLAATVLAAAALLTAGPGRAEAGRPAFGLQVDAGLPDGGAVAAVYRALPQLRVDAGLTYNLIGLGVRGGATLVPWHLPVSPSLRLEAGHTFESDASSFIGNFATLTAGEKRALSKFSYDYASAQLGLELGNPDRWVFFVRAGLAWIWAGLSDFSAAAQAVEPSVRSAADPSASGRSVTASAGVVFFFG